MRIGHKYLNISAIARDLKMSGQGLHNKKRSLPYQKLTDENISELEPLMFEMEAFIHRIETKEDFENYVDKFRDYYFEK